MRIVTRTSVDNAGFAVRSGVDPAGNPTGEAWHGGRRPRRPAARPGPARDLPFAQYCRDDNRIERVRVFIVGRPERTPSTAARGAGPLIAGHGHDRRPGYPWAIVTRP